MRNITFERLLTAVEALIECSFATSAQAVIPQLGHSYYIAAQTWDGKQYVERILTNTSGGTVTQELEITNAAKWRVSGADDDGAVTLLSPLGKRLMTGGISSGTDIRNLVSEPSSWTLTDHPADAVVILCKYNNKYIVTRNDGANMNGEYTSSMTGYNPKTTAYTQYFKFYAADGAYLTVAPNYSGTGAVFEFSPDDGSAAMRGNLWYMQSGTLNIVPGSYDDSKFEFKGFRVDGGELQQSVHTGSLTAMRSYISPGSSVAMAKTYRLVVSDDESGIESVTVDETNMEPDLMYDLSGRRIMHPRRGQPYILNGQVIIDR